MRSIVITGEGSYIGSALQEYLSREPGHYSVRVLPTIGIAPDSFDFHNVDAVINVAAIVHKKETPDLISLYDSVNRDLAIGLAKKAKEDGACLFIQFSTMSVYGKITGAVSEDTLPNPVTAYGRSKLEAERLIAPLADDRFHVAILRPPMVYGPGAKGNYHLLEKLTDYLFFCPTLQNRRSLVSVDCLCSFILGCVENPRSGVFFPQDPTPVSTASLIEQIASKKGKKLWRTSLFNPFIRFLSKHTTAGKKAFGDLVYENLSELPLSAVFQGESK
ncbi:MAG: NAD-dependent epimerase/dehydratase family protein [Clostridia bacterium]|nr:NAD-dependent epimerase/dehydratase family protein [Clostridia bacterium]